MYRDIYEEMCGDIYGYMSEKRICWRQHRDVYGFVGEYMQIDLNIWGGYD